ncbi:hypothetical protein OH77DRAFT_810411 [Trametes cingulata]|nr:hypothetical protein OH77DRAFT_810411 [Trametes cingulata]
MKRTLVSRRRMPTTLCRPSRNRGPQTVFISTREGASICTRHGAVSQSAYNMKCTHTVRTRAFLTAVDSTRVVQNRIICRELAARARAPHPRPASDRLSPANHPASELATALTGWPTPWQTGEAGLIRVRCCPERLILVRGRASRFAWERCVFGCPFSVRGHARASESCTSQTLYTLAAGSARRPRSLAAACGQMLRTTPRRTECDRAARWKTSQVRRGLRLAQGGCERPSACR